MAAPPVEIAGVPFAEVRALLQTHFQVSFERDDWSARGGDNALLDALIEAKLVECVPGEPGALRLSLDGAQLAQKRVRRYTAKAIEQAKEKVLIACEGLNADPKFEMAVEVLAFFGSAVAEPSSDDFGDLDVAVNFEQKARFDSFQTMFEAMRSRSSSIPTSCKLLGCVVPATYAFWELKRRTGARQIVKFHEIADVIRNGFPNRIVFDPRRGGRVSDGASLPHLTSFQDARSWRKEAI